MSMTDSMSSKRLKRSLILNSTTLTSFSHSGNTLYDESTTDLIEDFVDQNPPDLSESDLEQVAAWTDFVPGEFVVVRYREDDAIFLDWTEPPKAYVVRPARLPFAELWDESALPVPVSSVVLFPFEDQVVYDGWIGVKNIIFEARSVPISTMSTRRPNIVSA